MVVVSRDVTTGSVLVVDDSEVIVAIVSEVLRELGWKVRTAASGAGACREVQRRPPDVVVCDLHMPDMSGYDVLKHIETIAPDVPVIILSGDDDVTAVLAAHRKGAFDYVLKASDEFGPLLAAIERAAEHTRVIKANRRLEAELAERLEELTVARDRALTASRAKSAFLANMSHELRTPLNAILGYAEMLAEDLAEIDMPEHVSDLEKIRFSGKHLLALINDILDLAKIESGRATIYPERVMVGAFLRAVTATAEQLTQANGNELVVLSDPELEEIVVDQRRLRQILINLLGNSAKFTSNGKITLEVGSLERGGVLFASFVISDTGIGMTDEQIKRIFDAFVQADSGTSRKYGGTGLGLPITRQLVALMGGSIQVKSEFGQGTQFSVLLPAGGTLAEPNITPAPMPSRRTIAPGTTVLVVDDDSDMRELMERYLSNDGFRVVAATNGNDGIRLAREEKPSVICLDVVMPGLDGYDVLKVLKSDPELASIPVVMVTMMDDRESGLAIGASDYLMKPISRAALVRALGEVHSGEKGTVLVVDDSEVHRRVVRRMLEAEGWVVAEAENGRQALTAMRADRPTLILLDLQMPEVDGFEVLRELREDDDLCDIPVVVITAADLPPSQLKVMRDRVEGVIRKEGGSQQQVLAQVRAMAEEFARIR